MNLDTSTLLIIYAIGIPVTWFILTTIYGMKGGQRIPFLGIIALSLAVVWPLYWVWFILHLLAKIGRK